MIGRVYKIVPAQGNECYVGSTFNELRFRFQNHKNSYKSQKKGKIIHSSSFKLFDKYGIDTCKIMLIKEYEVYDKRHLEAYETLWISKLNCVNVNYPIYFLKNERMKLIRDTWRSINKERIAEKKRQFVFDKNYEARREYKHRYDEENRERINAQCRGYYERNKEKKRAYYSQKITCDICNVEVRRDSIQRHKLSKRHMDRT
jgi:hypothetical protein